MVADSDIDRLPLRRRVSNLRATRFLEPPPLLRELLRTLGVVGVEELREALARGARLEPRAFRFVCADFVFDVTFGLGCGALPREGDLLFRSAAVPVPAALLRVVAGVTTVFSDRQRRFFDDVARGGGGVF